MKKDILGKALDSVEKASNASDVEHQLETAAKAYGFPCHGLVRQPKPAENLRGLLLSGRFPEGWPEIYIRKNYILVDPGLRYLSQAQKGFRWTEAISALADDPHARRIDRMMLDARKHGLHDGYVFPVHGRRGLLGTLSLAGPAIDLDAMDMALFDGLAKTAFWRFLELARPQVKAELAGKLDIKLTHREMEALHYLSDGMTSPEIASVLKISNHTVDWYMNGIQQKLNAKNRHHAVSIAFRLGLIS